jgi:hypothetical protein
MSRFADILKKSLQVNPPSMGFRPMAASHKSSMVLVASISQTDGNVLVMAQCADVVILNIGTGISAKLLKSLAKTLAVNPWGIQLENDGQSLKQIEAAGADFILVEPDKMAISTLEFEKLGKVLFIEASMEDSLLRAGNELPFEAVIINRKAVVITWQDLMLFRKLSDMLTKPLLVPVLAGISAQELKALWEAGVDGVVVDATTENNLTALKQTMDELALTPRRKWLRMRPLVPILREEAGLVPEEDDDEDDDEP